MQGLLRKLGAGFDDLMPGMASNSQFKVCPVSLQTGNRSWQKAYRWPGACLKLSTL